MTVIVHDRLTLVTGTSSGIGAAVVRGLLDAGWTVVGLSRRNADFDSSQYRHLQVDLSDLGALREVAETTLAPILSDSRWQRVGLVNNAASTGVMQPVEDIDPASLATVFALNALAPIYLMGVVAGHAPSTSRLRIVNVSTGVATRPFPGLSAYGSSKAALRLAGMTLAAELQSDARPGGVRSNFAVMSYSPGVVDTPMQELARSGDHVWSQPFVDFHARGQLVPPQAPAADIVRFLVSDSRETFVERRLGDA